MKISGKQKNKSNSDLVLQIQLISIKGLKFPFNKHYPFNVFVYINIFPRLSVSGQSSPTVSPSTPSPPPTTTAEEYGNCPGNLIAILTF